MREFDESSGAMRGAVVVLILGNAASALSIGAILLERYVPAYDQGRLTRAGWAWVIGYASLVALCGAAAVYFGLRVRRRHEGPGGARPRKYAEIGIGVAVATLLMAMWPFGSLVHRKLNAPIPERWELDVPTAVRFWRGMTGAKRWEFTRALAFEGHAEGFAELLPAAASPDSQVRFEVAQQLFTIALEGKRYPDPAGAATAMLRLATDVDDRTARWAAEAAERAVKRRWIAHESLAIPLITALEATRPDEDETGDIPRAVTWKRGQITRVLAWIGPSPELRARVEALQGDPDCDDDLRQRCGQLLEDFDQHGVNPFREEFAEERR